MRNLLTLWRLRALTAPEIDDAVLGALAIAAALSDVVAVPDLLQRYTNGFRQ